MPPTLYFHFLSFAWAIKNLRQFCILVVSHGIYTRYQMISHFYCWLGHIMGQTPKTHPTWGPPASLYSYNCYAIAIENQPYMDSPYSWLTDWVTVSKRMCSSWIVGSAVILSSIFRLPSNLLGPSSTWLFIVHGIQNESNRSIHIIRVNIKVDIKIMPAYQSWCHGKKPKQFLSRKCVLTNSTLLIIYLVKKYYL